MKVAARINCGSSPACEYGFDDNGEFDKCFARSTFEQRESKFTGSNETTKTKGTTMKTKNKAISAFIALIQSKWTRPTLITLTLLGALLGLTGCPGHPH